PRAVVLQDDRVRRRVAPLRGPALVGARGRDAAELDRALRGRGRPVPRRGARHRPAGVHDPAGHALRSHVLRRRAGASARRAPGAGLPARGGDPRVRAAHGGEDRRGGVEAKEKTGVFTGWFATNPVNEARLPIWIADYVLSDYGTGAIMAVPAHDERDFEFAQRFDLPVKTVVVPRDREVEPGTAFVGHSDDGVLGDSAP